MEFEELKKELFKLMETAKQTHLKGYEITKAVRKQIKSMRYAKKKNYMNFANVEGEFNGRKTKNGTLVKIKNNSDNTYKMQVALSIYTTLIAQARQEINAIEVNE